MIFLLSSDFFQNHFLKFFQEYHLGVKHFGSRSGPTFLSGSKVLAKVNQQTTKFSAGNKEFLIKICGPAPEILVLIAYAKSLLQMPVLT